MNDFLIYSLQTIVLQLLFLVVFELFFKKETFFKANRFYLLGSTILSLLIPMIKIPIEQKVQEQYIFQLKEIVLTNTGFVENQVQNTSDFSVLNFVYAIGFLLFLTLFIIKLIKVFKVKQKAKLEVLNNTKIYRIENSKQAFSFLNYIFIGKENQNLEAIIKHEKVHQKQFHSIDLLFLESLKIIFWFNPMIYIYQKRIVEIHEFEADSNSVSENKSSYYETLICQIFEVNSISLTNNFYNQSLIKKRLVMLQKSKSKKAGMMKYLVVVPMTILSLMLFSTSVVAQVKNEKKLETKKEQLLNEIKKYNNNVPKEEKIKVLDENFLEEKIQEIKDKKLPIISDETINNGDPIPFATLDNPPAFEGCEDKTGKDARECFMNAMNNHIKKNFQYPKEALDKNYEGRVTVIFIIDKEGNVIIDKTKGSNREGSEFLEKETERIINLLPKFKPGMYKNKPVKVSYAQPIMFKLQKEEVPKPIEVKDSKSE